MEPECWDGEVVLVKWPAKCRKLQGKLLLTATRLVHIPDSPDTQTGNSLEIQLAGARSIKLEISKKRPGFDEALVRLSNLPSPPGKLVVEFTCPQNKWAHLSELSEWMRAREQEAKRLEEEQRQEAETLGEQLRSVLSSPELSQQYQYLVKQTGILTSSEFLEQHAHEISLLKPLPEAPAVDLAPLRVVAAAHRSDHVVSPEDRSAIFKELPELGQLHSATVPSMMTEAQFWERCLRSRFFMTAAGKEVPASHPEDRLFDSLSTSKPPTEPREPREPTFRAILSHLEVDLTGDFEADRPSKKSRTGALISRLNERSAGATAAMPTAPEGGARPPGGVAPVGTGLHEAVEKRRFELRNATKELQEDLGMASADTSSETFSRPAQLQLKPGAGALSTVPEKRGSDATAKVSHTSLATPPTWTFEKGPSVSEAGTRWVLKTSTDELLAAERLLPLSGSGGDAHTHTVAPEPVVRAVTLLRHFWSSRVAEKDMRAKLAGEAANLLGALVDISKGGGRNKAAMARSIIPALRQALDLHAQA
ncbi:Tfb1, partial [Symbiodinium natans]